MTDKYFNLRVPRFDRRKTLIFNGLVIAFACGCLLAVVAGVGRPLLGVEASLAIIAVAAANGLLRCLTCEPIFRRPWERELYEYEWPAPHLAACDLPQADDVDDHPLQDSSKPLPSTPPGKGWLNAGVVDVDNHARRNADNATNIREYLDNRLPLDFEEEKASESLGRHA